MSTCNPIQCLTLCNSLLAFQQQIPQPVYSVRHQNQAQMQGMQQPGMQQHPQAGGPATQQGANTAQILQTNAAAAAASGQYMQQGTQYIIGGQIVQPVSHTPIHS